MSHCGTTGLDGADGCRIVGKVVGEEHLHGRHAVLAFGTRLPIEEGARGMDVEPVGMYIAGGGHGRRTLVFESGKGERITYIDALGGDGVGLGEIDGKDIVDRSACHFRHVGYIHLLAVGVLLKLEFGGNPRLEIRHAGGRRERHLQCRHLLAGEHRVAKTDGDVVGLHLLRTPIHQVGNAIGEFHRLFAACSG